MEILIPDIYEGLNGSWMNVTFTTPLILFGIFVINVYSSALPLKLALGMAGNEQTIALDVFAMGRAGHAKNARQFCLRSDASVCRVLICVGYFHIVSYKNAIAIF